ncbi:MAG: PEP/pyruvate-binding domain-containing protein [bacterium]
MKYIKNFSQINKDNVDQVGGKGASLGEMTSAGFPVPPGFVIVAEAYDVFDNSFSLDLNSAIHKINFADTNSIEKASNYIRDVMNDSKIPEKISKEILEAHSELNAKLVAVRSSATAEDSSIASWAGELETYLNTTKENLNENIKKCWSSLFTPRAIFYRYEKQLTDQKVSVAVVVQKMIESEVSGICFTVHPVTKDRNQMIIEAGWGLGEAVVSGSITPDSYVLDKSDFALLDINVAEQEKMLKLKGASGNEWKEVAETKKDQQKLNGEKIIELAKLCKKIEEHYGSPQDIEWAYADDKFYITQSRPITTL